jgi:hypothetical protein
MKVLSTIPWLMGGLMGSGLVVASASWAAPLDHQSLVAQQVTDGLPPPPPLIFGQESMPTSLPSSEVPPADIPYLAPTAPGQQYLVIVNGDSPLLLSQVQTVAAGASIQEYSGQRYIQAGLFDNPSLAQQQVSALAAQGIGAEIVTVGATTNPAASSSAPAQVVAPQTVLPAMPPPDLLPATPVPREVEFGQPPAPGQLSNPASPDTIRGTNDRNRAFYVIVPGSADNLEAMANQIIRLGEGIGIASMVQTDNSRGSHVRVGPFVDRGSANRWRRYLRDFGMDARVYYR